MSPGHNYPTRPPVALPTQTAIIEAQIVGDIDLENWDEFQQLLRPGVDSRAREFPMEISPQATNAPANSQNKPIRWNEDMTPGIFCPEWETQLPVYQPVYFLGPHARVSLIDPHGLDKIEHGIRFANANNLILVEPEITGRMDLLPNQPKELHFSPNIATLASGSVDSLGETIKKCGRFIILCKLPLSQKHQL